MIPEIAVMLDPEGMTTSLTTPGAVAVYTRKSDSWEPVRITPFSLEMKGGIVAVRTRMAELVTFLGECRIFVARAASGAVFFELEKAGCTIWEIEGKPSDFLDPVWQEEEKQREEISVAGSDIPVPVEISPGKYYLSIRDFQGKRPEVTSKQLLQTLIRTGNYRTLEVICDHVPPWIALESSCCGFTMESCQLGPGEVKLVLTKSTKCPC
jgi:Fe-only nitrogenase accessory protein AnfO